MIELLSEHPTKKKIFSIKDSFINLDILAL
jgi:hypothetical protein